MSLDQVVGAILAASTANPGMPANQPMPAPAPVPAVSGPVAGYGPEQLGIAQVIVEEGRRAGIPARGIVVCLAAAMQESGLRNLDYGHLDSLGILQQRPEMGWGTQEEVMTPAYAARKFYAVLRTVPGWQEMELKDAADAVQRSYDADPYAKHEQAAIEIAAALGVA